MADYIVIRLVAPMPVDQATFKTYLSGLTLQVYDVSYAHPAAGTLGDPTPPLGTAQYKDPTVESLPAPYPGGAPYVTYPLGTGIVQHFDLQLNFAFTQVLAVDFMSVATAMIAVPTGSPEYVSSDIRVVLTRPAAQPVFDGNAHYDVTFYSGGAPTLDEYPGLPASSYLTLPATTDPSVATLQIPSDGTAPNYDLLVAAINKVVVKDPAIDPDLASLIAFTGPLTAAQARNIAYEIVWGSRPPLPAPSDSLENMYTDPPNTGASTDTNEQSRQQFEGDLSSFYSTRNAQAEQLTKFVFSASAAIWCELQTQAATRAHWLFPTNPTGSSALATVVTTDVVLTGAPGALTIDVPGFYFYALTAQLPAQISPPLRMQATCGANEQQNLTQLIAAVDANIITVPGGAPDPSQAVRMLNALSVPGASVTQCPVALVQPLWTDWLAWTPADWRRYRAGDELEAFWPAEVVKPAPVPGVFLELVLYALTEGYIVFNSLPPMLLADDIKTNLIVHDATDGSALFTGVGAVSELARALQSDWQGFFDGSPLPPPLTASMRANLLPPFTNPGGATAFIQHVRKFFDMPTPIPVIASGGGGAPSLLDLPTVDWIQACLTAYGPFTFGTPLTAAQLVNLQTAAAAVFPGDVSAQQWVVQAIVTINELTICAQVAGTSAAQQFSFVEALFARGFTGFDSILDRPLADFQQALTGTVAYDYAMAIYTNAGAPHAFPSTGIGPFGPINEGTLRNCIPPRYLSPLGPIEYLHEMLQVSEASSCNSPAAPPAPGHTTLEGALDPRRGPLGTLQVTDANLSTPIPLIDIVNECLEFVASTTPPTSHGSVYDTAADVVADHLLCVEPCCEPVAKKPPCHMPPHLYAALPQYSTPATPVAQNAAVEPAVYDILKRSFSSCCLPYSQALDVSETYLQFFGSCRFEEHRSFRRCITEFVLDPVIEPSGFQSHLWRYPVRIDTAIEYLGITPEEYVTLFQGPWPASCASPASGSGLEFGSTPATWILYGFQTQTQNQQSWIDITVRLPQFLRRLCLTYCEFLELWQCGYVPFSNGAAPNGEFPVCEPCCLDDLWLKFPAIPGAAQALFELYIFVRVHRKLRDVCGAHYSFLELADICSVLRLFPADVLNSDFIRQLAAFQILRDRFKLPLVDKKDPAPLGSGAERTAILALWVGPAATKWDWALRQLLHGIAHHECRREHRVPEFIKLLVSNLDALSRLAGFNPSISGDSWAALPTHTLRFAEVLSKIHASSFGVGELLYLFTADPQLDGNEPFPAQYDNEALDFPFGIPDDDHTHSLARLRREMLDAENRERPWHEWTWPQVAGFLVIDLGFSRATVQGLGQHLFHGILREAGIAVNPADVSYAVNLDPTQTAPLMWATPPGGAFQYEQLSATSGQLSTRIPLRDTAVIRQLTHLRPLQLAERTAVQSLYWQARADLAQFGLLFPDMPNAEHHLLEDENETRRWEYFRRHVILCHARCEILACHLAEHVSAVTGEPCPDGARQASLILKQLFADENRATVDWQGNDAGSVPTVTWAPPPAGGALAALLGLNGTGLLREYSVDGAGVVWRDVSGALSGFGAARNEHNCPLPTVIPALDLTLDPQQMQFVSVLNGLLIRDSNDEWLGGAQGFCVRWNGALLVEQGGLYEFCAGSPAADGLRPACDDHERSRWRVELKRGQNTCVLLEHDPEEKRVFMQCVELRRGAYDVHIRFEQPPLIVTEEEPIRRQRSGFQLKWKGPDTEDKLIEIPRSHLYCLYKDTDLAAGINPISAPAAAYLHNHYVGTLRDIRRTYQRAFKALLFAHRLRLSAHSGDDQQCELGYLLSQPARFAGVSYYRSGGGFVRHAANFDFNFLPLLDNYYAPTAAEDSRVDPSLQREQALFDWWERLWDFGRAREEVFNRCERHLWRLCDEAATKMPAHPQYLLRHMGADVRHWDLDTRFYQDQGNPVYVLTSSDLSDDRWVIRAWHADLWIRAMQRCFTVGDITQARPDLWASFDPSAPVSGETQTGNANLSSVLGHGLLEVGQPCRYADLQRLNDGLRERGRHALLAYLCGSTGIVGSPKELSELLLIDVEAGLCERSTRIDEAISAVQLFVQRARLGLEPGWSVTRDFACLWDARFASFHTWEVCRRRELYKENWIDWHELERARKIESFGFLDGELRRATLTIATPGGVDYWPDQRPPPHAALTLLQRDPSTMKMLAAPREGLGLLGTPGAAGRPSWLAPVDDALSTVGPSTAGNGPGLAAVTSAQPRTEKLPLWIEAAMRLGTRFIRVAAGAYPPAAMPFEPRKVYEELTAGERCVECCTECGCVHPRHMDEYYFWLVDANQYDASTQDSYYDHNLQEATPWQVEPSLGRLLQWSPQPMVRLAWCRVHNGEFQPPRRSVHGIEVRTAAIPVPDLVWAGRAADSLYFTVSNAATAIAPNPGFRYDIAIDAATADDNLTLPAIPPGEFPGALNAYPYFAYHSPGARLFPWSLFTPAVAVAEALRTHCKFEAALKWYELVYAPLESDNTWLQCAKPPPSVPSTPSDPPPANASSMLVGPSDRCCDSTDVSCAIARNRAVLLHYLETLLQWSQASLRRNSPEAFQHARLLLDTCAKILGPKPAAILNVGDGAVQTVATFVPLIPPLNPRLIEIYEHVFDRLEAVHACLSARRLKQEPLSREAGYWGDDPVRQGSRTTMEHCAEATEWCYPVSPYRFSFLVQKAQELAARVHELGAALLAAIEKGDVEYLAAMRQRQEHELLTLGRKVREDQWRDSDWQLQALQKTKESDQSNRRYFSKLISDGNIANEHGYDAQTELALGERVASNVLEGVAELMDVIPDIFVGFPCEETQLAVGTKLAGLFKTLARVTNTLADISGTNASQDLTHAGWDRRLQEWVHQVEVLDIEIEQAELQILGAERRREQAVRELNNQEREIENSKEVLNFLRDKWTSHPVYLWLQKEGARLHYRMYELALHTARQAERAFNLERGHTTRRFLPETCWSELRDGLLAGERLQLALSLMEKEYLDRNVREFELSTDFALRRNFPMEFLRLKLTGRCEIDIPEWMFDLEYPGHFMRRIKSMSLTIPCVVGPFTGVHCRLTLLCSETRIDPSLATPAPRCCDKCHPNNAYEACPHDPRVVRQYGACEAIATSRAQNDPGLFELNFRDERHLPFEYSGAVSRWRIELPQESNYFDMDSLSEVILHMNYTAREGGSLLRRAAEAATWDRLPNRGWCLFDVRHDFPDAWATLHRDHRGERPRQQELRVGFDRRLFPFIPGACELAINKFALVFEAPEFRRDECCWSDPCPCPAEDRRDCHGVEVAWTCREGANDRAEEQEIELHCERSIDWPEYYYGAADTCSRRVGFRAQGCEARIRFPARVCDLPRVYLLCRYAVERRPKPPRRAELDCLQAPPPVTSSTSVTKGQDL